MAERIRKGTPIFSLFYVYVNEGSRSANRSRMIFWLRLNDKYHRVWEQSLGVYIIRFNDKSHLLPCP